jgi:CheY-like chemotaxis protein
MSQRKRFGEILLEAGVVTEALLEEALQRQKGSGKRLGQVLEEMGEVSETNIAAALARQFGFRTVRGMAGYTFPEAVLGLVPGEEALKKLIFPLKVENKTLFLAMVNPLDMATIDNLTFQTGLRIVPCVTIPGEIQEAVNRHYFKRGQGKKTDWWTVLVVEDQEMVRAAVVAALKKLGYMTLEAANGAEGLKAACQHFPHLIVSDTVMPRMDGYEMFRSLQANPGTRDIPVIALSSKSAAEEEARLLEMGYFDFVGKPINPVRLLARVKRALKIVYGEECPSREERAGGGRAN